MSTNSAIEWTDATWNPVTGCSKVSPGCAHCYAETVALRFWSTQYVHTIERGFIAATDYNADSMDGKLRQFTDVMTHEDRLEQPLRWRKPRRVFVNSMSDLFHEDVPDAFIDRVFAVMALAPRHTFQVLTKRADRMLAYVTSRQKPHCGVHMHAILTNADSPLPTPDAGWPLPNVWLGVSVENQHFADERIPLLLQTPAAVRFISAEPLLGPVDVRWRSAAGGGFVQYLPAPGPPDPPGTKKRYLDWVIIGGESGPGARPFDVAWARAIVARCKVSRVACFVKQLGANVRDRNDAGFTGDFDGSGTCWPEQHAIDDRIEHDLDGTRDGYQGAPVRIHLRQSKGSDIGEWPEDLRVRQFPPEARQ